MNAQHTPGPWIADCEEGSYGVFVADDGREIARLHDKRGNFPQSSFSHTQYLYDGQHEANARLIAAAPDLLAAAQDACDNFQTSERHHPNHVLITADAFNCLRAAIARATGAA